jgi:hypothetical protein
MSGLDEQEKKIELKQWKKRVVFNGKEKFYFWRLFGIDKNERIEVSEVPVIDFGMDMTTSGDIILVDEDWGTVSRIRQVDVVR